MKLSESLRKNIFDSRVGGIVNSFVIRKRRNFLFFEDILANYIKECERHGYEKDIEDIGEEWMSILAKNIVPRLLIKIIFTSMFNTVANRIWVNIGAVDEGYVVREGNSIHIKTKNEFVTRIIGDNSFSTGVYKGIVGGLIDSKLECSKKVQSKDNCEYSFEIQNKPVIVKAKDKNLYYKLNRLPNVKAHTLKDALRMKIFQLKGDGRIYFRDKMLLNGENTLFHLLSNKNLLPGIIPEISHEYFKELVKESSDTEKINFLKTILQCMGWGIMKIMVEDKNRIVMNINYLPCGFQAEKNNYSFLISTILGYLWLVNKELKIKEVEEKNIHIRVVYSI